MITELSDEAVEYGGVVRQALEAAGGDRLLEDAEADPAGRVVVADVLGELGAWDLDVADADQLEAAAALCRAAGWWGVPYPVAERLAAPSGADGLVVVDPVAPAGRLDGLPPGRWVAVALDGTRHLATPRPAEQPARKSAFVTGLDLAPLDDPGGVTSASTSGSTAATGSAPGAGDGGDGDGDGDLVLGLTLPCWTLLGMLDRAVHVTCRYVGEREQFGVAIGTFQGVQFQLTEAEVERSGVEELAKYALWSGTVADALALRLAAVEAAEVVFRVTHQLHGAIGFCDETTLSWLSRHSQPLRRLPLGVSATRAALADRIGRRGLSGLFDELAEPTP